MDNANLEKLAYKVEQIRAKHNGIVRRWPICISKTSVACVKEYGYSKVNRATKISSSCLYKWVGKYKDIKINKEEKPILSKSMTDNITMSISEISATMNADSQESKPIAILKKNSLSIEIYSKDFFDEKTLKLIINE